MKSEKRISIKKSHKINIEKISVCLFVLILAISAFVFLVNSFSKKSKPISQSTKAITPTNILKKLKTEFNGYVTYINRDFRFSFQIPAYLSKNESTNSGGYNLFIRFIKNKVSEGENVFIGITSRSVDEERNMILESIKKDSGLKPSAEEKTQIDGEEALIVYYIYENTDQKAILITKQNKTTISVSTTPKQLEVIVNSFKRLE